jgi:methionine-rich copper-binding protein CopC
MNMFLKGLAAAAVFAGLSLAAAVPALAHAHLREAVPAADSTISAPLPTELKIGFTEAIELAFTQVVVTGEDGTAVPLGPLALAPDDPQTLIVPLAGPLPAGTVTVEWTAVAADGHKSNGSYTLVVAN